MALTGSAVSAAVVFYGLAVTSFTYVLSFLFKSGSSAQSSLLFVFIIAGAVLLITR